MSKMMDKIASQLWLVWEKFGSNHNKYQDNLKHVFWLVKFSVLVSTYRLGLKSPFGWQLCQLNYEQHTNRCQCLSPSRFAQLGRRRVCLEQLNFWFFQSSLFPRLCTTRWWASAIHQLYMSKWHLIARKQILAVILAKTWNTLIAVGHRNIGGMLSDFRWIQSLCERKRDNNK